MIRRLLVLIVCILAAGVVGGADFATEVLNSTFKLYDPDSTATCFVVRDGGPESVPFIVTAVHSLERTKGETAIVVLRKEKEDGSYERLDFTISIRRDGKELWTRHPKQDVAVIRLDEKPPIAVAGLPTSLFADSERLKAENAHICSELFVLTFPQRFEANRAGFPVARQGIFASPPLLPVKTHPTFLADFTTFAGDSGGPVFMAGADGRPLLLGIVLAQFRHDERVKTEYEERIIHHPLGLGNVLHAHYVLETLKLAASVGTPR